MATNRSQAQKTTRTGRTQRPTVEDRQDNRFSRPGHSDTATVHLRRQRVFFHLQQGGKRNGALLGSLRQMREPTLPLHEALLARHELQVVKAQIHTQRAGEDPNLLRDGRATSTRAKKVIVYYTIENQLTVFVEPIVFHFIFSVFALRIRFRGEETKRQRLRRKLTRQKPRTRQRFSLQSRATTLL